MRAAWGRSWTRGSAPATTCLYPRSGLTAALGADQISAMAAKAGVPDDVMASGLAKALPGIVDTLTPEGFVPDAASLAGHFAAQFGK